MHKIDDMATKRQLDSLHVWFRQVAQALNDSHQDMTLVIEHMKRLPITPTEDNVKAVMWKPVQKALYDTNSVTQLHRDQVSEVYDHLNRLLASLPQPVYVPFPEDH